MKKILLSLLVSVIVFSAKAQLTSACAIEDILVQNVSLVGQTSNTCTVKFDAAFTIDANGGNKYLYIQSYIESQYPDNFGCLSGPPRGAAKAPKGSQIANAFINLAFTNDDGVFSEAPYFPDPSKPTNDVDTIYSFELENGLTRVVVKGLIATLPQSCATSTTIYTDVFSSNANNVDVIQCVNCGIRTPSGFITIGGSTNCAAVLATLTNNTGAARTVNYWLYVDMDGDSILTTQAEGGVDSLILTGNTTINGMSTVTIASTLTGDLIGRDVFVLIELGAGARRAQLLPTIECIPLPVGFQSINANRNRQNVVVEWQTSFEQDNRGFNVQRKTNGQWQTIAFVPTKAYGGNSNDLTSYTYTDNNNYRGISQYRVEQVDLNGQARFSPIRSVRGEEQSSKVIVYPNPSTNGSVNVVFDNNSGTRDLSLTDINGRVIKQWKAVTDNNVSITNLLPGMYNLRILNITTGDQVNEKIIVTR